MRKHLRLTEVLVASFSAERYDPDNPPAEADQKAVQIEAMYLNDAEGTKLRLNATAVSPLAIYRYAIVGVFAVDPGVTFSAELLGRFTEEVGMAQLHPFVREGLYAMGIRLGSERVILDMLPEGPQRLQPDPVLPSSAGKV